MFAASAAPLNAQAHQMARYSNETFILRMNTRTAESTAEANGGDVGSSSGR